MWRRNLIFEANLAAYVAAAALIMAAPGPANMLVMSRGASSLRAGVIALLGLMTANLLLLGAATFGISSLVLASQTAFLALKWIGAAYLLFLGVHLIRNAGRGEKLPPSSKRRALDGFLTGVTNPKALIFYFAFLPQFLTDRAPAQAQLIGLGIVDLALVAIVFGAYAMAGSSLMRILRGARVRIWLDRSVGGVMVASAALVLRTARPAT